VPSLLADTLVVEPQPLTDAAAEALDEAMAGGAPDEFAGLHE
jgi:hypothetical protein